MILVAILQIAGLVVVTGLLWMIAAVVAQECLRRLLGRPIPRWQSGLAATAVLLGLVGLRCALGR
ncbi:MAG: hypothetical protein RLZZ127_2181 [Planctomycetota bacterium]|jgi:hypothetical protein